MGKTGVSKSYQLDKEILEHRFPECAIVEGTYAGPGAGPARKGWFARWPTGRMEYLGKTLSEAVLNTHRKG